ncbi:MAG: hypothetical protein R3230_00480 [Nitrosopumilaceae archaeon]|nr:hypothetical protein [Nitrosopumilaceae archaeon]
MIWHPNLQWYYEFERGLVTDSSSNSNDLSKTGSLRMEMGTVSLSDTIHSGVIESVTFQNTYDDPVVFCYIPVLVGSQFCVPRVENVTSTGCDIFMEEPDDEGHSAEICHYFVIEKGVHILNNGDIIEAGSINTTTTHISGDVAAGDTINFSQTYSDPTFFHFIQTRNSNDFAFSFCTNLTTSNSEIGIELLQTGSPSTQEEIAYLVYENSSITGVFDALDGTRILREHSHALQGANAGFDDTPYQITFSQSYSSAPKIIMSGHTVNGADGWAPRGNTLSATTHDMYCDEDQIGDTERNHTAEEVSWMVFSEEFAYDDTIQTTNAHVSKSASITANSYALIPHSHNGLGEIGDMTVFFRGTITPPSSIDNVLTICGYDRSEYWVIGCGRTATPSEEPKLQFSLTGETSGTVDVIAPVDVADSTPHFCAATYKKSTGVVTLYMDGVEIHSEQALQANEGIGTGVARDGMLFTLPESSGGDLVRGTRGANNTTIDTIGYINGTCLELHDIERIRMGFSPIKK